MADLSPPDHKGPPSHGRASRQLRKSVLQRLSCLPGRQHPLNIPMSRWGYPRLAW